MSSFYFEIFRFIKIRTVWNLVKGMTCKIVLIPFKRLLKSYTLSPEERPGRHTLLFTILSLVTPMGNLMMVYRRRIYRFVVTSQYSCGVIIMSLFWIRSIGRWNAPSYLPYPQIQPPFEALLGSSPEIDLHG
ncbi:hypothetical protein BO83DRAFT_238771 [Aspergillus eucalypticola CBS 122712]|uniref:Uncharacterized protein n=1 Tax=Aspergillus eucalypticola (strain CBS 122712 / IBT 29274) TaxID=1448314 RepID=A0A317VR27_ASPEC|nr:uncharacterized protein BO83DRAFT_238771 [Aspergillus eucalypticola CBS 122712]PWY76763.1 hypothetical protein BO83DRAFT_238771 [Aspergillus eucalypticola CBS 122712]